MRADVQRFLRASTLGGVAFQISTVLVLAVFVTVGLKVFHLSQAELIVLVFVFSRIAPRFSNLQSGMQDLLRDLPAFDAIQATIARCRAERDETGPAGVGALCPGAQRLLLRRRLRLRLESDRCSRTSTSPFLPGR